MKKKLHFGLFLICLGVFAAFRIKGIQSKENRFLLQQGKPFVPEAIAINSLSHTRDTPTSEAEKFLLHPWLLKQRDIQLTEAIVEDLSRVEKFCSTIHAQHPQLEKTNILNVVMDSLTSLQSEIPFAFTQVLYNILFIPETEGQKFQVHQRLYLGESTFGLPLYLDVRVYEQADETLISKVVEESLLSFTEGGATCTPFLEKGFLIRGVSKEKIPHALGPFTCERGIFLYPELKGDKLYLAAAEAPWENFKQFIEVFSSLKINRLEN